MSRTSLGQRQQASSLRQAGSVRRVNQQEEFFQTHLNIHEEVEYFLHMREKPAGGEGDPLPQLRGRQSGELQLGEGRLRHQRLPQRRPVHRLLGERHDAGHGHLHLARPRLLQPRRLPRRVLRGQVPRHRQDGPPHRRGQRRGHLPRHLVRGQEVGAGRLLLRQPLRLLHRRVAQGREERRGPAGVSGGRVRGAVAGQRAPRPGQDATGIERGHQRVRGLLAGRRAHLGRHRLPGRERGGAGQVQGADPPRQEARQRQVHVQDHGVLGEFRGRPDQGGGHHQEPLVQCVGGVLPAGRAAGEHAGHAGGDQLPQQGRVRRDGGDSERGAAAGEGHLPVRQRGRGDGALRRQRGGAVAGELPVPVEGRRGEGVLMTGIIVRVIVSMMNFNVHRRTKSFLAQHKSRDRHNHHSQRKAPTSPKNDSLLETAKAIYSSQQNLPDAVELFKQFLALSPRHNEALYLCAVTELHLGRCQEAVERLSAIGDDFENRANAMLLLAMALNKLGSSKRSMEVVTEAVRRYEHFEEALCFRGKLHMGAGLHHKAELDFKAALGHGRSSFLGCSGLADCYRLQGKLDKALHYYRKALELSGATGREESGPRAELELKTAICLYELEKYRQAHESLLLLSREEASKSSELFYYLGQCELRLGSREKGLLHLEYALRLQTNPRLVQRAFKKLVQAYLENYQFYEALNVVRLGEICGLDHPLWKKAVEGFMLVIKAHYEEGVASLTEVCAAVRAAEEARAWQARLRRELAEEKSERRSRCKHAESGDIVRRVLPETPHRQERYYSRDRINKKVAFFSTKSVSKAIPKIESTRLNSKPLYAIKKHEGVKFRTEHEGVKFWREQEEREGGFSGKERELMVPLVLQFKAYGEFFLNSFFKCLDTYEEYEAFIKDFYGRESDVGYNKGLCEALLMAESDLEDEALKKYSACVDLYYEKYAKIPAEPLLYKVLLLMRLALAKNQSRGATERSEGGPEASFEEILESCLEMVENYMPSIGHHPLTFYLQSLILLLLDRLEDCRDTLEKTLKVTEECSWKYLYVKGVVEMQLGNYYEAVKEFSAGLILESRPELYLGRSISFLMLSEREESSGKSIKMLMKSVHLSSELSMGQPPRARGDPPARAERSDLLVENCFEDLQKYIELEGDQEEISLWVSKILFANRAYDEAIRSLSKISRQTEEVLAMIECVEVYEGELEGGGRVGAVIKSAFDGAFLSREEEERVLSEPLLKNYNDPQFGYLTRDYEKWLVVLHLYVRGNYSLLLRYLQKELFGCEDEATQAMLRFNLAVLHHLAGEPLKAQNVLANLAKMQAKFDLNAKVDKLIRQDFEQDECVEDIREELGFSCSKLLSNYLPYSPLQLTNLAGQQVRVYLKPILPFPKFVPPALELAIGSGFVLEELNQKIVDKKIEAPWIHKVRNRTIQFTEKLEESCLDEEMGFSKSLKGQSGRGSFLSEPTQ